MAQEAVFILEKLPMKRKDDILRKLKKNRRMSVGTFWMEVGTRAVSYLCAVIVMTMILSAVLPGSVRQVNQICIYAAIGLATIWAIPFIRFTRMRLRDIGFSPKAYLWLLLPVIGWIVFAGLMCRKGTPQTPESAVEVL
jgi:uncharacterized membrane protein YhaH (DUF805 family)